MAKIVFNIAYFSPIVISRCWAQEETKRETTEINMGEKQEKRGGGACYLAAEGRNFHRYSSPRPFAICHHSFISVFTASSCLMPCRFANNAAPPPPLPFFLRVRSKNIRFSVIDRSSSRACIRRRLQQPSVEK